MTDPVPERQRRLRHPAIGNALIAMAVSVTVGGCGSPVTSPSQGTATASATLPAPSSATSAAAVSPTAGSSSLPGSSGPAVALDPDLLLVVPVANRTGIDLTYDPQTSAADAADPGVVKDATAIAVALVRVTGSSATSDDIAVMSVIRLRDPTVDDAWFRAWRDSYDESACAQAGGVVRHAEVTIAGHHFFVASCANGAFTYHARVRAGEIVVAVTSIGTARLGELVMTRLAA